MTQRTAIPEWLLLRAVEQVRVLGQVVRVRARTQPVLATVSVGIKVPAESDVPR